MDPRFVSVSEPLSQKNFFGGGLRRIQRSAAQKFGDGPTQTLLNLGIS